MSAVVNIAEEIRDRADIVGHIERVVKLRKRGALWVGLCPFHNENTPSFKVYGDSQHYHCYGCGASGDVISFYMKYYNLDFIEAATRLADELGIDWKPGGRFDSESRRKEFYDINREAALYYHQELRKPGCPGFGYLAERGIAKDTMTAFGLGYADDSSDGLSRHLAQRGASLEKAAEMGLIISRGGEYRSRYFNRVMFPLMNVTGKVVGFSARTIDPREKEKKIAKYINSSESDVFHKKDNLYAINLTKGPISAAERTAILVEGQMDVVSVWQHGVKNVTASLGTALTEGQARLLKRFADRVVLAYDMDESGREAAVKGGVILRAAGLDVKVMSLPSGKDPDEFMRSEGKEAFLVQAESAMPFLEYRLTRILGGCDVSGGEWEVEFVRKAAGVFAGMSPVERDHYVRWVVERTGVSAAAVEGEIRMLGDGAAGGKYPGGAGGVHSVDVGGYVDGYGGEYDGYVDVPEMPRAGYQAGAGSGGAAGSVTAKAVRAGTESDPAWADASLGIQRGLIGLLAHSPAFLADLRGREACFTAPGLLRLFRAVAGAIEGAPGGEFGAPELPDAEDAAALRAIVRGVIIEEDPARQLGNYLAKLDVAELKGRRERVVRAIAGLLDGDGRDGESIDQLVRERDEIDRELSEAEERIRG